MKEELRKASSVFLDTSAFIYHVEKHSDYFPLTNELFAAIDRGEKLAITSPVTVVEVLTKPFEKHDLAVVEEYRKRLLLHPQVKSRSIDNEVATEAARIRANFGIKKTPDALQLAVAKLERAQVFLTNDKELKRFTEIQVVLSSECLVAP
mgnify:CR=1 FL=1